MQATTIYNGMIHPLKSYAIRGAIWYQGESDASSGLMYCPRMKALVAGWRQDWSRNYDSLKDFPFYYVQLPAYGTARPNFPAGGDGWTLIREAQLMAMAITNTGMACTIDIGGSPPDLHPRNKLDAGKRLALWALAKTYNRDIACSGPICREFKVEGNKIRISFDYADKGLMAGEKAGLEPVREAADNKIKCFAIAGEDKAWHRADAAIEGNTVVASCIKVPKPAAARYAYSGNPEGANLYNKEGLPAVPFRTDKWE
jgi:sialate O-acetylesterase